MAAARIASERLGRVVPLKNYIYIYIYIYISKGTTLPSLSEAILAAATPRRLQLHTVPVNPASNYPVPKKYLVHCPTSFISATYLSDRQRDEENCPSGCHTVCSGTYVPTFVGKKKTNFANVVMAVAGTCETSAHTHHAKLLHTTQSSKTYSHIPANPVLHSYVEYFCTNSL